MKVKFEVEIDIEFDDAANIRSKSDLRDEKDKECQNQNIDGILSLLEYKEKSNSLKFAIVNE